MPAHVNESTDPVDHPGGVLSVILVGSLILAINFAAVPNAGTMAIGLGIVALAACGAFLIRERRAASPLYDLKVASRRIFWVAAVAGIIVFGSLMAAMFVGQQYLQNVLGYDALEAGAAILPAAALMVLIAPRSAKLVESHGARFTLLLGYLFCLLGFGVMFALWSDSSPYWQVGLGYALVGAGVGFAGTPASHSSRDRYRSSGWAWPLAQQTYNATSVAPSCSQFSAHCSLRGTRRPCPVPLPMHPHQNRTKSPTAWQPRSKSPLLVPSKWLSSTRSTPTKLWLLPSHRSSTAPTGRTSQELSRCS